jgi:bacterioferritin
MEETAVDIMNIDVETLIVMLNEALSEEWQTYYQYWIGSRLMEVPLRSEMEPKILLHATQELDHAVLVASRIIQLGGTPVINSTEWTGLTRFSFNVTDDTYVETLLEQNLKGVRCAIHRYKEIADFTKSKDPTTFQIATTIIHEESEHEQAIKEWLNDITQMKEEYE